MLNPHAVAEALTDTTVLAAGVAAAAAVWKKRWYRCNALHDAPPRQAGLELFDLAVGLGLMLAGMVVVGIILWALDLTSIVTDKGIAGLSPRQQVEVILLSQACTQLPIVAYLALRAATRFSIRIGPWRPGRTGAAPCLSSRGGSVAFGFHTHAAYVILRAVRWPDGLRELGLWPRQLGRELRVGLIAFCVASPLIWLVLGLSNEAAHLFRIEQPPILHEGLELLTRASAGQRAVLFVAFVIVAPILEEAIFRGLVQTTLLKLFGTQHRRLVIVCAATLFATIHIGSVKWIAIPGLWVLGVALGWLYERTGSLWPGIATHALFNAWNCILALLMAASAAGHGG
jgi:membrane protease YdiL (CAAX protease family)